MKKRLLALMLVIALVPKPAFAYSTAVFKSYSPKFVENSGWFTGGDYILNLGEGAIDTIYLTNDGFTEGAHGDTVDHSLDKCEFTYEEIAKLAKVCNEADTVDICYVKGKNIPKIFGYSKATEDTSGNVENRLLRDTCIRYLVDHATGDNKAKIGQLLRDFPDLNGNPTYMLKECGLGSTDKLHAWGKTAVGKAIDEKSEKHVQSELDSTIKEGIEGTSYSDCVNALMVLSNDSADKNTNYDKFVADIEANFPETDKTYGLDTSDGTQQLIARVINQVFLLSTVAERRSALEVLYGRGSKFAINTSGEIDAQVVRDLQPSSAEGDLPSYDDILNPIATDVETILKNNKNMEARDKEFITIGLRAKYCYYAMQVKDYSGDSQIDELTFGNNSKSYTRVQKPDIINEPKVYNYKYEVGLYNIVNDMDRMASAIVPVLKGVSSENDISGSGTMLAAQELRSIREAYDLMYQADQTNPKIKATNKFKVVDDIWHKKIPEADNKSLADIYEAMSGFLMTLPDVKTFDSGEEDKPLHNYLPSIGDKTLCDSLKLGMGLSATYVPMKTNIYEPATFKLVENEDDFFIFHARYGYNRKALYIDTDASSAGSYYTTGTHGNLKLCTLKDLLQCEKDITLYTDDNFYNIQKLQAYRDEGIQTVTNGGEEVKKTDDGDNVVEKVANDIWDKATDAFTVNIEDVCKTGDAEEYPRRLAGMKSYAKTKDDSSEEDTSKDHAVLNGKQIDKYINEDDDDNDYSYNVMRAFAFTSAVYRDTDLFNLLLKTGRQPVFMSSKSLANMTGVPQNLAESYFNYALLKNIEDTQSINYKSYLDKNKPVYMDVYGNILTESGIVVIPFASNATLNKDYNVFNTGFLSTYGNNFLIPEDIDVPANLKYHSDVFIKNDGHWEFDNKSYNGSVDLNQLSTSDDGSMETIVSMYAESLKPAEGNEMRIDYNNYVTNVFMEVMRGAPLETVDKEFEGLNRNNGASVVGLSLALKLDEFTTALKSKSENTILALPNILFMPNIEVVILVLFKLALVLSTITVLIAIFRTGMGQAQGWKAIVSLVMSIVITIGTFYALPFYMSITYYNINKFVMQDSAAVVNMLSTEKREAGMEVGVADVTACQDNSKLYLKLKDVDIDWYEGFNRILKLNSVETIRSVYDDMAKRDLAYGQEGFEYLNGSLYISTDTLFNSVEVVPNTQYNTIYTVNTKETPASFYTPFYVFLKSLSIDINEYNMSKGISNYSLQTYGNGKIKSLGMSKAFFLSDEFANDEDLDLLDLKPIYGLDKDMSGTVMSWLTQDNISKVQQSYWCDPNLDKDEIEKRIDLINKHAREYVAKNRELIGKVSDDTFLKCMALDLALYHNTIFNVDSVTSYEIYNLSNEDITRLISANKVDVAEGSPLSTSRFVYTEGGSPAVILAGFLELINFISGWLKPLTNIFVVIIVFISLFVYRFFMRKKTSSLTGYFIIITILSLINLIYALFLRFAMFLASIGTPTTICLFYQICTQMIIVALYCWLIFVVSINWKDLGNLKFQEYLQTILAGIGKFDFPVINTAPDPDSIYTERANKHNKRIMIEDDIEDRIMEEDRSPILNDPNIVERGSVKNEGIQNKNSTRHK